MMTRFASWEGNFWDKSYEEYEDGFGAANQQWLGLKNIQRITHVFNTDMRVDYTFQEDFTFSTIYYNMKVDTKENSYKLSYERYDSNGCESLKLTNHQTTDIYLSHIHQCLILMFNVSIIC